MHSSNLEEGKDFLNFQELRSTDPDEYFRIANSIATWPFAEAKNLWEFIGKRIPEKGYVLFASGFGPSGLPHIGTAAEILRVHMVKRAFNVLYPDVPTLLFIFSDDMDGLRKVPENFPNQQMLREHIGEPVCNIPDPYGQFESFSAQMNSRLLDMAEKMQISFELKFCSQLYRSGVFNKALKFFLENVEAVRESIVNHFGDGRKQSYEPFLPVSPNTGRFIMENYTGYDFEKGEIRFIENGKEYSVSVFDGNSKLQWLADWAMRWIAMDVDYEMHGKDITPSADVGKRICKALKKRGPMTKQYELFVDDYGKKISKSKNNGISMLDWLEVSDHSVLAHYLYFRPERTKKLSWAVIPKATDAYLADVAEFFHQGIEYKLSNAAWYAHGFSVPYINLDGINFSLLISIISGVNGLISDDGILNLIYKYTQNPSHKTNKYLLRMIPLAQKFVEKVALTTKSLTFSEQEKQIVLNISLSLQDPALRLEQGAIYQKFADVASKSNISVQEVYSLFYLSTIGMDGGPKTETLISILGIETVLNNMKKAAKC